MTVRIRGNTRVRSQTLVGFPPQPALNLNFTQGYANGLNPLPSTVTFTRNDAGAYATQVGPDGLVRLAAHNIATYSQDFGNAAWTKSGLTVATNTADTQAPDGTSTANKFNETSAPNADHRFYELSSSFAIASTTTTVSVYLKDFASPNNSQWVRLEAFEGGTSNGQYVANFDITNGIIGNNGRVTGTGTFISANMVNVGNGWYRCSISFTQASNSGGASTNVGIYSLRGNGNIALAGSTAFNGNTSYGFYSWGFNFERNPTPSYYVPTTSAAVYANTPRFDYSPVTTEPLGLLIEEQRVNALLYSQDFTQTDWTKTNLNTTGSPAWTNVAVAPDGTTTAEKLIANTTSGLHTLRQDITASNVAYTFSIYLKSSEYVSATIQMSDNSTGDVGAIVNLAGGTIVNRGFAAGSWTNISFTLTAVGNGWYRATLTATKGAGTQILTFVRVRNATDASSNGAESYAGNDTSGLFAWGAQLEAGSFATSYIPTVASAVTRAVESATMTGTNFSSWFNATTGTFLVGFDTLATGTRPVINLDDNTANEQIQVYTTGTTPTYNVIDGGTPQATITTGTVNNTGVYLLASEYGVNDFSAAMNGTLGTPDTSGTLPTVDRLRIGSDQAGNRLNDHVTKIQYWPARFTDARLQLLSRGP